jgi:hypothetical protein
MADSRGGLQVVRWPRAGRPYDSTRRVQAPASLSLAAAGGYYSSFKLEARAPAVPWLSRAAAAAMPLLRPGLASESGTLVPYDIIYDLILSFTVYDIICDII